MSQIIYNSDGEIIYYPLGNAKPREGWTVAELTQKQNAQIRAGGPFKWIDGQLVKQPKPLKFIMAKNLTLFTNFVPSKSGWKSKTSTKKQESKPKFENGDLICLEKSKPLDRIKFKMVYYYLKNKLTKNRKEIMKNWKTTITGIGSILSGLGVFGKALTDWVNNGEFPAMELILGGVGLITAGAGLIFGKDANP